MRATKCLPHTLWMLLVAAAIAPWCSTGAAADEGLQVGTGMSVITPDPLLPVSGGLGPSAPVKEKRGELTVRAVVFRQKLVAVAFVQVDALGFPSVLGNEARALVPTLHPANILIGATHTHSAPCCYAFPVGKDEHTGDLTYMHSVAKKIAESINTAVKNLQPAKLRVATGEAKGKIAYNYYAPDLYDRRMSVIEAVRPDGGAIVTLVNYAIHPEVLGPGAGILSPDLVGPLCDRIESQNGGMAMFMNGAQGGMITADNRNLEQPSDPARARWNDQRTWEECVRIGTTMADEALRIIAPAPLQENPTVFSTALDVTFPVESDAMWNVVVNSPLQYPHRNDRTITSRVNVVNLGNAQILTIPGEALPNIGFYLKRKMHGEHNLLFGLTNDAFGYILTKVDFNSFSRYDYVSRTSLGEQTGEIYIDRALTLVDRCPRPDKLSTSPTSIPSARPKITIDGNLTDWAGVRAYFDPESDTHDTDHELKDDEPAKVNHPDVDLVEYRVTHDAENLYFYLRSKGQIGSTQKATDDKAAGRSYVIVTIDVDDNDDTGYWIHEGGYYPTSRGYDVNAEIEFFDGEFNTACYLNHGAKNPEELKRAFMDQSANQYQEGTDGPYTAGFMRLLSGTYKQYTQWVPHEDGTITFVRDKGPVVHGIANAAISADGHVIEAVFPMRGFLKDENGKPIIAPGRKIDLSFSLEASGELAPDGNWASDSGEPIVGYELK